MSDAFAAGALRLEHVTRTFQQGEGVLEVFSNLTVTLNPGELVALVGPSGANACARCRAMSKPQHR
jgi:predicted ABC-type transport system involved in lysophospholipase L1 biosynthesis ATPase subunit